MGSHCVPILRYVLCALALTDIMMV